MELSKKWIQLHNGSDICGVSTQIKGGEAISFTPNQARNLTAAFIKWLSEKTGKEENELKIAVGRDSRISGPFLKKAILKEISNSGSTGYDCDLAPTPAVFMTCIFPENQCDGSIMISAGHLPSNRNGLKFFTADGSLNEKEITILIAIAQYYEENQMACDLSQEYGENIIPFDVTSKYAEYLKKIIIENIGDNISNTKPLKGMKILVDASNGVGGFFVDKVLKPLGADTQGSCFLESDGNFPGHIPNPENKNSVIELKKLVIDKGADFGIIFDTDVCSMAAIDKFGKTINRNKLIALISAIILDEKPNTTVVTDSITSLQLTKFIKEKLKGKHHRYKRGYQNVVEEAKRLNNKGEEVFVAIETSGHCSLKENYFINDASFLASKLLIKIILLKHKKMTIDSLIQNFEEPLETVEKRFNIYAENFKDYGLKILEDLKVHANENSWKLSENNYEGVRIEFPGEDENGWLLLRMSLHDRIMPLNVESNVKNGVKNISRHMYLFLNNYDQIDISPLRKMFE